MYVEHECGMYVLHSVRREYLLPVRLVHVALRRIVFQVARGRCEPRLESLPSGGLFQVTRG